MLTKRGGWRVLALSFAGLALVAVEWAVLYPHYTEVCTTTKQTGNQYCATYHVAFVPFLEVGDFVENHDGAIVALGTLAIAAFTFTLWWTTRGTLRHLEREYLANHRPRLRIRHVAFVQDDNDPSVDFTIVNVGESDAMLIESSVKIWIPMRKEKLPGVPPYDPPTMRPRTQVIENGREVRWREMDGPGDFRLMVGHVTSDMRNTMLLGYLIYADGKGTRRRVGFCRRRVRGTDRFVPSKNPDYEYED